jgi:anti-sigma B factor antagonist
LEVRRQDGETRIRFRGLDRLDEANSEILSKEWCRLAEKLAGTRLVLDLTGIRLVTSSALGRLVALHRKARAAGGRLVLVNLSPAVTNILAVTNLDRVLELLPASLADGANELPRTGPHGVCDCLRTGY